MPPPEKIMKPRERRYLFIEPPPPPPPLNKRVPTLSPKKSKHPTTTPLDDEAKTCENSSASRFEKTVRPLPSPVEYKAPPPPSFFLVAHMYPNGIPESLEKVRGALSKGGIHAGTAELRKNIAPSPAHNQTPNNFSPKIRKNTKTCLPPTP